MVLITPVEDVEFSWDSRTLYGRSDALLDSSIRQTKGSLLICSAQNDLGLGMCAAFILQETSERSSQTGHSCEYGCGKVTLALKTGA